MAALVGGVLNARGPFASCPIPAHTQLRADFEAERVERILQWQDQLEVTESGQLLIVVVPPGADLAADLARVKQAGGVAIHFTHIPDLRLGHFTPWIPVQVLVAAALIGGARADRRSPG